MARFHWVGKSRLKQELWIPQKIDIVKIVEKIFAKSVRTKRSNIKSLRRFSIFWRQPPNENNKIYLTILCKFISNEYYIQVRLTIKMNPICPSNQIGIRHAVICNDGYMYEEKWLKQWMN